MLDFLKQLFDPQPEISLVDLKDYEAYLRNSVNKYGQRGLLFPPPPIPQPFGADYTPAQMKVMRENRRQAEALYQRAKTWEKS